MVCALFPPTRTFPKLMFTELAASCPWTPTPPSAIDTGDPGALLAIEILPDALPDAVGAKTALKLVPCPDAKVNGKLMPFQLNPLPAAFTDEIVSGAFPEFVRLTDCVALRPNVTLPKLTLVVPKLICGCPVVPVPLHPTTRVEFEAVLVIVTFPDAVPEEDGVKLAVNVADRPAPSITGNESPLIENPVPLAAACEIVMLEVPVFFNVTVWLLVVATVTLPKAMLVGLALNTEPETAVPDNGKTAGEPPALLTMLKLPLAFPDEVGANCTLNAALWLAAMVSGSESAPRLKPDPVTFAAVIVKGAFPVFDTFTLC